MPDQVFGSIPIYWYILNIIIGLLPPIIMFLCTAIFGGSAITIVVIHLGIMVLLPFILMQLINWYRVRKDQPQFLE